MSLLVACVLDAIVTCWNVTPFLKVLRLRAVDVAQIECGNQEHAEQAGRKGRGFLPQ